MEELLVFAFLLCEEMVSEEEYEKRLDELFLACPENDDLLHLEWETDIVQTITYIRSHTNYDSFNYELFGKILMERLKEYYEKCSDIKSFARKMYQLWEELPQDVQMKEPFWVLSYADDPLSWGDEEQTRELYEKMMNYYID